MLRQKVWWPTLNHDIEELLKRCHSCQVNTLPKSHSQPLQLPEPPPPQPLPPQVGQKVLVKRPKANSKMELQETIKTVLFRIKKTKGKVDIRNKAHIVKQYFQKSSNH